MKTFSCIKKKLIFVGEQKILNKNIMCISESKVYHIGSGSNLSSNDKIYFNHRNSLLSLVKNVDIKKLPVVLLVRSFLNL